MADDFEYKEAWDAIYRALHNNAEEIVEDALDSIKNTVDKKWWVKMRIPLKSKVKKEDGLIEGEVIAGTQRKYIPVFIEYGTKYQGATPALIPATEAEAAKTIRRVKAHLMSGVWGV